MHGESRKDICLLSPLLTQTASALILVAGSSEKEHSVTPLTLRFKEDTFMAFITGHSEQIWEQGNKRNENFSSSCMNKRI